MPKRMLRAFVEELGREWKSLLEGAMEDGEVPADDDGDAAILITSYKQVKKGPEPDSDDDDDDD
jgi:hypothetical protein